mmetsp:Transcript_2287/g.8334  ORF Transcript_2287/g.8334 Transcript_2287/m.8334 type:complete len:244 (-) Transcript_2287:55-786(-)
MRVRWSTTRLTRAWVGTRAADSAKWSVERVCSTCSSPGWTQHKMAVRELPPSACCRIRVSLELRNGMCACVVVAPAVMSPMARMTFVSVRSERLMAHPSLRRTPAAPVRLARSDPARSTRCSVAAVPLRPPLLPSPSSLSSSSSSFPSSSPPPAAKVPHSTVTRTTRCERDEASLSACRPTRRRSCATSMRLSSCSTRSSGCSERCSTTVPRSGSSSTRSAAAAAFAPPLPASSASKSRTTSL